MILKVKAQEITQESEAEFNQALEMGNRRWAETTEKLAAQKERGDFWRNCCWICIAVILLRCAVLLGWFPPIV